MKMKITDEQVIRVICLLVKDLHLNKEQLINLFNGCSWPQFRKMLGIVDNKEGKVII